MCLDTVEQSGENDLFRILTSGEKTRSLHSYTNTRPLTSNRLAQLNVQTAGIPLQGLQHKDLCILFKKSAHTFNWCTIFIAWYYILLSHAQKDKGFFSKIYNLSILGSSLDPYFCSHSGTEPRDN